MHPRSPIWTHIRKIYSYEHLLVFTGPLVPISGSGSSARCQTLEFFFREHAWARISLRGGELQRRCYKRTLVAQKYKTTKQVATTESELKQKERKKEKKEKPPNLTNLETTNIHPCRKKYNVTMNVNGEILKRPNYN